MKELQKIHEINEALKTTILSGFSVHSNAKLNVYTTDSINRLFDDVEKADDPYVFDAAVNFLDCLVPIKEGSFVSELDVLQKGKDEKPVGYITPSGKFMKTATGWKAVPKGKQTGGSTAHAGAHSPAHVHTPNEKQVADSKKDDANRKHLTTDDRWNHYETALNMVLKGRHKAAIAYGRGGLGKTYTLEKMIDKVRQDTKGKGGRMFDDEIHVPANARTASEEEDEEVDMKDQNGNDYDFVKITGKNSLTTFWRNLYEHNGKTLLYDDCDSVLDHEDVINILKGALDTSGNGTVEYRALKGNEDTGEGPVPRRFKFTGRIIFITNLGEEEFKNGKLQPLKTRALTVNLTMDKKQTLERAKKILPNMVIKDADFKPIPGVTLADKDKAVKFMEDHMDEIGIGDFNARTLGTIIKCVKEQQDGTTKDWKGLAAMMLGMEHFEKADQSDLQKANDYRKMIKELDELRDPDNIEKGEVTESKPLGKTKSGKQIYQYAAHKSHADFTVGEHIEAANLHEKKAMNYNGKKNNSGLLRPKRMAAAQKEQYHTGMATVHKEKAFDLNKK